MYHRKIYHFSKKTLSYEELKESSLRKLYRTQPILCLVALLLVFSLASFLYPSPTERSLDNKNKNLSAQLLTLNNEVDKFEKAIDKLSGKDDSLYRAILGVPQLSADIRNAGLGGKLQHKSHSERVHNSSIRLEKLNARLKVQDQSFEILLKRAYQNKEKMLHIPAIIPIDSKDLSYIGSGFGMRYHSILKIMRMHEGIDLYAGKGSPIFATAQGRVKVCRYSTTFGKLIVIDHGNGIETYYAHLSAYNVKQGDSVKRGQVIGTIGSTGLSSGRHLHYEVHVHGKETDPVHYFFNDLTPKLYDEIKRLAARETYSMD